MLSKKQREKVQEIRDIIDMEGPYYNQKAIDLLSIIDSLQPKQYTVKELRSIFIITPTSKVHSSILTDQGNSGFNGWIECARHFGMLKE